MILCQLQKFQISLGNPINHSSADDRYQFGVDIFRLLAINRTEENVIFSPVALQTCVGLAYLGASGRTKKEIHKALRFNNSDRAVATKELTDFLNSPFQKSNNENDTVLSVINRIYANSSVNINPNFTMVATKHFQTEVEKLNFEDIPNSVKNINSWIEEQTNNKIQNFLCPNALSPNSLVILVNAIYLKAKWEFPFSLNNTQKSQFAVNGNNKTYVDMMCMKESFRYANLFEINATALELPFNNTDMKMLILLPDKVNGLKKLERRLGKSNLLKIRKRLRLTRMNVQIPRFHIHFDMDFKQILKKLGMKRAFDDRANLTHLVDAPNFITQVRQKTFIDINEAGSETTAETFETMPIKSKYRDFYVNRPFVFIIYNPEALYFMGHVTKF